MSFRQVNKQIQQEVRLQYTTRRERQSIYGSWKQVIKQKLTDDCVGQSDVWKFVIQSLVQSLGSQVGYVILITMKAERTQH